MKPRRVISLFSLIALAAMFRLSAQPPAPVLPGTAPAKNPLTAVPEKKSDAPAPVTPPAATPDAEKSPDAVPAAKAKSKSLFALPAATATKTFTPPPLSPRFLQIRQRIDALFAQRNDPPPPPDARFNPFRPSGPIPAAAVATKEGVVEREVVNNNLVLLQQAVATLKVHGTVRRGKLLQLAINTGPGKEGFYGEGDIINVNLAPDPVHLRVRVVTGNSVTFTLGDAEMALKY